jgi:hypothetical protein
MRGSQKELVCEFASNRDLDFAPNRYAHEKPRVFRNQTMKE